MPRTLLATLLSCLLLAAPAAGDAKPGQELEAADKVLAAVRAKDTAALQKLAAERLPDPWLVADVLLGRGEAEAARAFAAAAPRTYVAALPAYVEQRRGKDDDKSWRERLIAGSKAIAAGKTEDALAASREAAEAPACVVRTRLEMQRGVALRTLGKQSEAREAFVAAAATCAALGWPTMESVARSSAGDAARRLGDADGALAEYERCAQLRLSVGDPGTAGRYRANMGRVHNAVGRYQQAVEQLEAALPLLAKGAEQAELILAESDLGLVLGSLGDPQGYLAHARRARDLAMAAKDAGVPTYRLRVADALVDAGQGEEALREVEAALAVGDERTRGDANRSRGRALALLGRLEEAQRAYDTAAEVAHARGDTYAELQVLTSSGNAWQAAGDLQRALAARQAAVPLAEGIGQPAKLAVVLSNLANSLYALGRWAEALRTYERALDVRRDLGEDAGLAQLLLNIANVHDELGEHAKARELQEQAADVYRRLGDPLRLSAALVNLAQTRLGEGDVDAAERAVREALALLEAQPDPNVVPLAWALLGQVQRGRGDLGAAHASLTKAVAALPAATDPDTAVSVLSDMAELLDRRGETEAARRGFEDVARRARAAGRPNHLATALMNLGALALRQGRSKEALDAAAEAVEILPGVYAGLSETQGAGGRSAYAAAYEIGARAAQRLGRSDDVVRFLELGRAAWLVSGLRARSAMLAAAVPEALRTEEAAARSAEAKAAARMRGLTSGKPSKEEATAAQAQWTAARARLKAAIERIQREAARTTDGAFPRPLGASAIGALLPADTALVLYLAGTSEWLAAVVTRAGTRVVVLGPGSDLDAACRPVASAPSGDVGADAVRRVAAALVAPLGLGPEVRRVVLSPDGPIAYLPFALLFGARAVSCAPSGTTLGLLQSDREQHGEQVLAFADPAYGSPSPALAARFGLSALPASREEARAVGDVVWVGAEATETRLREAVASRPRWRAVHLACHGLVDAAEPGLSALALGPSDTDDGLLTALDIFRLRVPADLVVLSACETGRGKVFAAEGVVGLTRAFMFAGAPRVLVSQWRVDDRATMLLMRAFYERWRRGTGAAVALREAQRVVEEHEEEAVDLEASRAAGREVRARRRPFSAPRFWAGWALWGLAD